MKRSAYSGSGVPSIPLQHRLTQLEAQLQALLKLKTTPAAAGNTNNQAVQAATAAPAASGTPGQVTLESVSGQSFKTQTGAVKELVSVAFQPSTAGSGYFTGVDVWVTGYHGSTTSELVASGQTSPLSFLLDVTGETVDFTVQATGTGGDAEYDFAPTASLALNGVTTAPPQPTVTQYVVAIPTGYQFSFNQEAGLLADIISGYNVYRNSSDSFTGSTKIAHLKQDPTNSGSVVFQDQQSSTTQQYYWVTAVNTSGLESAATAAQTGASGVPGIALPPNPTNLTVSQSQSTIDGVVKVVLTIGYNAPNPLSTFAGVQVAMEGYHGSTVVTAIGAMNPFTGAAAAAQSFTVPVDRTGETVTLYLAPVNSYGVSPGWASVPSVGLTLNGALNAPTEPTNLTVTSLPGGNRLDWSLGTEANLAGYIIARSATNVFTDATVIGHAAVTRASGTPPPSYYDPTQNTADTYYYWVQAVDTAGNTSTAAETSTASGSSGVGAGQSVSPSNTNIVPDSDFLFGATYWTLGANFSFAEAGQAVENAGGNLIQFGGVSSGLGTFQAYSTPVAVYPSSSYTLSAYLGTFNLSSGTITLAVMDPTRVTTYGSISQSYPTYGRVYGTVTIPASVTTAVIVCDADTANCPSGKTCVWGAMQLEYGSQATSYKPGSSPNNQTYWARGAHPPEYNAVITSGSQITGSTTLTGTVETQIALQEIHDRVSPNIYDHANLSGASGIQGVVETALALAEVHDRASGNLYDHTHLNGSSGVSGIVETAITVAELHDRASGNLYDHTHITGSSGISGVTETAIAMSELHDRVSPNIYDHANFTGTSGIHGTSETAINLAEVHDRVSPTIGGHGGVGLDNLNEGADFRRHVSNQSGPNLFQNGDFEQSATLYAGAPAGWQNYNSSTLLLDTTTYNTGAQSLKVTGSAAGTGAYQSIAVHGGEQYYLTGAFMVSNASSTAKITVDFFQGSTYKSAVTLASTTATVWTPFSYSISVPAGMTSMIVYCYQIPAAGYFAWFDSISLIRQQNLDNEMQVGTTYGRVRQTEMGGSETGRIYQLNDGTNVRTSAQITGVVDSTSTAASGVVHGGAGVSSVGQTAITLAEMHDRTSSTIPGNAQLNSGAVISGRTEGIGTTVQNVDSTGIVTASGLDFTRAYTNKNVDNVPDGTTYARTKGASLTSGYVSKVSQNGTTTYNAKGVGDAQTLSLDSEIADGTTYNRVNATAVTSGNIDFSKSGFANKTVDNVADGSTFVRLLGTHASGNVAYNYKGVWLSTTSYVVGDEVVYEASYWIATAASSNQAPATGSSYWQVVGTYSGFEGAWSSTTAYVGGAEVTYNGNFWVAVSANTNSTPTTSNANWQIAGPSDLDNVADGTTYIKLQGVGTGHQVGWHGLLGDTSGDTTTSIVDTTNKRLLHSAMSGPVQAVVNTSNQITSTTLIEGRTENIGTTVTHLTSTGEFDSPDNFALTTGSTYGIVKVTELASNTVKQINDGTNIRTAAQVTGVVDSTSTAASGVVHGGAGIGGTTKTAIIFSDLHDRVSATIGESAATGLDNLNEGSDFRRIVSNFPGPNLFQNGDFEQSATLYAGAPAGWKLYNNATLSLDTTTYNTGLQSLKVTGASGGTGAWQTIACHGGEQYYITGAFKVSSTNTAEILIDFYQGSTYKSAVTPASTTSTSWTSFSYTITVPAGITSMQVYCYQGVAAGDFAWFDSMSLIRLQNYDNEIQEGATYNRVLATAITSGSIDFSKSGFVNKTVDHVGDGTSYARTLAAGLSSGYAAKTGSAGGYNIKGVGDAQTLSFDNEVADGTTYVRLKGVDSDNTGLTLGYSGSPQMQIGQNGLITISTGGHQIKRTVHTEPLSTANGGNTYPSGETIYFYSSGGTPYLLDDGGNALPTFDHAPAVTLMPNNITPPLQLYASNVTTTSFVLNAYSSGTTKIQTGNLVNGTLTPISADSGYDYTTIKLSAVVNTADDTNSHGAPLYSGTVTINYTVGTTTGSFSISWASTGGSMSGSVSINAPASTTSISIEESWSTPLATGIASVTASYTATEMESASPVSNVDFTAIISEPWS